MTSIRRVYGKRPLQGPGSEARKRPRGNLPPALFDDAASDIASSTSVPALSSGGSASDRATSPPSTPRAVDENITHSSPRAQRWASRNAKSDLRSFFSTSAGPSDGSAKPSAVAARKGKARAKQVEDDFERQLELDLSNRPKTGSCAECGMAFRKTAADDTRLHERHHQRVVAGVEYSLSGDDNTVERDIRVDKMDDSGCIVVLSGNAKGAQGRKVKEVLAMIDTELSSTSISADDLSTCRLFMLVSTRKKRILACAVAAPITSAYPVVPSGSPSKRTLRFGEGSSSAIFCSATARPAQVGIHRIWTCRSMRRSGLAARVLDAIAARFVYAQRIDKMDVAFSQPTGAGAALARRWTGQEYDWLVFEG